MSLYDENKVKMWETLREVLGEKVLYVHWDYSYPEPPVDPKYPRTITLAPAEYKRNS